MKRIIAAVVTVAALGFSGLANADNDEFCQEVHALAYAISMDHQSGMTITDAADKWKGHAVVKGVDLSLKMVISIYRYTDKSFDWEGQSRQVAQEAYIGCMIGLGE